MRGWTFVTWIVQLGMIFLRISMKTMTQYTKCEILWCMKVNMAKSGGESMTCIWHLKATCSQESMTTEGYYRHVWGMRYIKIWHILTKCRDNIYDASCPCVKIGGIFKLKIHISTQIEISKMEIRSGKYDLGNLEFPYFVNIN